MNDIEILKHFLKFPIWTSDPIFEEFKNIPGSVYKEGNTGQQERFLFIEGKRKKKVVLVAHADTFFDKIFGDPEQQHRIVEEGDFIIGLTEDGQRIALGADDRAGCAILWALRDSGHSLLITDGEERSRLKREDLPGRRGSRWLMDNHPGIAKILNDHQFMIQFDLQDSERFKCYSVGTPVFKKFISEATGFKNMEGEAATDICTLCTKICGVNFSVGYHKPHTDLESINIQQWSKTLDMARAFLEKDLPRFGR